MDNAQASDRLQDLYLTEVRPNGKDIGVGAYGKVFVVECTAKTARYRGVRYNAKQYPPLYQTYATAEFRDYTARISADKRGGTLHDPPQYKTHPPVY